MCACVYTSMHVFYEYIITGFSNIVRLNISLGNAQNHNSFKLFVTVQL